MEDREQPPTVNDKTRLSGVGPLVGRFWVECKVEWKCIKAPYDRLLTNPVLRADYHCVFNVMRDSWGTASPRHAAPIPEVWGAGVAARSGPWVWRVGMLPGPARGADIHGLAS